MNYTDDEIQTAVSKVVQSTIQTPYGILGNRDTSQTFNDFQTAAAGALVGDSASVFYIVQLGTQRLVELVLAEADIVTSLLEAIQSSGRQVTAIDNLAPLANARAALAALSAAASSRSTGFTDITSVPAYKRYDQSTQSFLDTASQNVLSSNTVVPTPQQARAELAGLVSSLQSAHADVVARVGYLIAAVSDYDSLQLPSLLAAGVLSSATQVLSDHYDTLSAQTPTDRLASIKDVTLDLLAGRAAVTSMAALVPTTLFAVLDGTGAPFVDADHPATPAVAVSLPGPYPVFAGHNGLDFTMDGSFSFNIQLPGSFVASVDSTIPEPYKIIDGADSNKHLIVDYAGLGVSGRVEFDLSGSYPATKTASQVAGEFNVAAIGTPLLAQTVYSVLKFRGVVGIANNAGPGADFTMTTGQWSAIGVKVGDLVNVTDPASLNLGKEYTVTSLAGAILHTTGPTTVTETGLFSADVGLSKTLRITVMTGQETNALNKRMAITFPNIPTNTALNPIYTTAPVYPFGFTAGAVIRSRSTDADTIAASVPLLASTQLNTVPRLTASTVLTPIFEGSGRTNPDDPAKLIAYVSRGTANTAGGTTATFTVGTLDLTDVVAGMVVVIRETPVMADQNVKGIIIAVTPTTLQATMDQSVSTGTQLLLEVGPNFTVGAYADLQVSGSQGQDGDYTMDALGQEAIPFEFVLERPVPGNRAAGGQPQFFSLVVGHKCAAFGSTDVTAATAVQVTTGTASASDAFFTGGVINQPGTTQFFQIPKAAKSIDIGDTLEFYNTVYNQISSFSLVTDSDPTNLLLTIDPAVSTVLMPIAMSDTSQVPFARVRLAKKNTYTTLASGLTSWSKQSANQPQWFTQLYALINPLISANNPTLTQVNTAKMFVQGLLGLLTVAGASQANQSTANSLESLLDSYTADPVSAIDTLVQTYLAKGSDRGVDILLQGRFDEFFGLSQEAISYGGNFREQMRGVAMQDLPVKKAGRLNNMDSELTDAEWQDQDFEFDHSDADTVPDVDIPGEYAQISPPGQ